MTTRAQRSSENNEQRHTALMVAALEGHTKEVKALLRQGEGVNAKDSMGRTALMFAVINMHYETVKVLLDSGAYVNARSNNGGTALMAATCGEPRIVQALLDQGADTDATPLETNINATFACSAAWLCCGYFLAKAGEVMKKTLSDHNNDNDRKLRDWRTHEEK